MKMRTSYAVASMAAIVVAVGCGEDDAGESDAVTTVTVTVTVQGPAGPAGPPGPVGSPGLQGPKGDKGDPGEPGAPAPTAPVAGGGMSGAGGSPSVGGGGGGGGSPDDLMVLVGYDTEIPGAEATDNTVFMDAMGMPLAIVPTLGSEETTTFAEFMIPFDGTARQQFGWNTELGMPTDLSGMELVIRMRWVSGFNPDNEWGGLQIYAFSSDWTGNLSNWVSLDPTTKGMWVEYALDLSMADVETDAPQFDPATVNAIGFTFNTGGTEEMIPAATEAVFQVDYLGVRPVAGVGGGGAPAGGSGGMPGGGGGMPGGGGGMPGGGGGMPDGGTGGGTGGTPAGGAGGIAGGPAGGGSGGTLPGAGGGN